MSCPYCEHQVGHEADCKIDGATKDELAAILYNQASRILTPNACRVKTFR